MRSVGDGDGDGEDPSKTKRVGQERAIEGLNEGCAQSSTLVRSVVVIGEWGHPEMKFSLGFDPARQRQTWHGGDPQPPPITPRGTLRDTLSQACHSERTVCGVDVGDI
jgi:hypothetical protein